MQDKTREKQVKRDAVQDMRDAVQDMRDAEQKGWPTRGTQDRWDAFRKDVGNEGRMWKV